MNNGRGGDDAARREVVERLAGLDLTDVAEECSAILARHLASDEPRTQSVTPNRVTSTDEGPTYRAAAVVEMIRRQRALYDEDADRETWWAW